MQPQDRDVVRSMQSRGSFLAVCAFYVLYILAALSPALPAKAMPPRGSSSPVTMQISASAAVPGATASPTAPIAPGSTCLWTSGGTQVSTGCGPYTFQSSDLGKTVIFQATPPGITLGTSASCPQGTGWNDGCAGAQTATPLEPAFTRTFFTNSSVGYTADGIARQSGQSYLTLPPYNVAGVDFPVGPPATPVGGWLDPDTLVAATGGNCAWTQITVPITTYEMFCNHVNNLDVENIDFTHTTNPLASGQSCIPLSIRGNDSGYIRVRYNKFVNGSGCSTSTATAGLVSIINGNVAPIDFEYNYLDGKARSFPSLEMDQLALLDVTPGGPNGPGNITTFPGTPYAMIVNYNVLLHVAGRPINSNTFGSIDAEDNYIEGFILPGTGGSIHGEIIGNARNGCPSQCPIETMGQWTYLNNTVVMDADATGEGSTLLWANTGLGGDTQAGDTVSYLYAKFNTLINNLLGGPGGARIDGTGGLYIEATNVTNAFIDKNYIDPGAAFGNPGIIDYCFRDTVPLNGVGPSDSWLTPGGVATNFNMISGVAQKHWNVDGWSGVSPVSAACDKP